MKKFNFLFLLLLCAFVSCTETDDDGITPATTNISNPVNLNALIVGKWQLAEIGTVQSVSNSGGCGNGSSTSSHDEISWSSTQMIEKLYFKESGDFTRDMSKDAFCKGTYQINFNNLSTKSDCGDANGDFPIDAMTKTEMILTVQQDNETVKYKYLKQ